MMYKAIRKAISGGMTLPDVQKNLRRCGYDLTVKTEVDKTALEIMFEVPDDEHADYYAGDPRCEFPVDGAEAFEMMSAGIAIIRRGVITKRRARPNFVLVMALLGSPLEGRR